MLATVNQTSMSPIAKASQYATSSMTRRLLSLCSGGPG